MKMKLFAMGNANMLIFHAAMLQHTIAHIKTWHASPIAVVMMITHAVSPEKNVYQMEYSAAQLEKKIALDIA